MNEKDILEKSLEEYNDVFSDIINVLFFDGKPVIKENELENAPVSSYLNYGGTILSQYRDVAKIWKNNHISIVMLGMENQTEKDPHFPLRVIGYDGAKYKNQYACICNSENSQKKPFPVITFVLYFGKNRSWEGFQSLKDCLDLSNLPPQLHPFINDYKVYVFNIGNLKREQVNLFTSDFVIAADYFVQLRETNQYEPSRIKMKHPEELHLLMSELSGDAKFRQV